MKKLIIFLELILFSCEIVFAQDIPQAELVAYYKFDEVAIYNVALSDDQIKSIYDSYFTSVDEQNSPMVTDFNLHQNYPNSFNSATQISYTLPTSGFVTLKVYNALGKEINTLVKENQSAGTYSILFNATGLPSGVYFYKLQAGIRLVETKKMLLMQ